MFQKRKGIAPVVVVLIVALGLIGGTAVGYGFKDQIKKTIGGQTTQEEIDAKVKEEMDQQEADKSKFQLEGTTTFVDVAGLKLTVKIKSSTNSIAEMRLSETPITITEKTSISNGNQKDLKIADIPINSQIHVGGTIKDNVLTATKVIIQKEDVDEANKNNFSLGGKVTEVGTDSITVNVTSANKKANSQKGKNLKIIVNTETFITKEDKIIALTDLKKDDLVQVIGVIKEDIYTASKIVVKVQEQAGELEEETEQNQNQGESTKEKNTEQNKNSNSNSNSNNSNSNKNK